VGGKQGEQRLEDDMGGGVSRKKGQNYGPPLCAQKLAICQDRERKFKNCVEQLLGRTFRPSIFFFGMGVLTIAFASATPSHLCPYIPGQGGDGGPLVLEGGPELMAEDPVSLPGPGTGREDESIPIM